MSSVLFILSKILLEHYLDLPQSKTDRVHLFSYSLYPTPYTVHLLVTYKQVHQIETVHIDQTHVCQL